MIIKDNRIVSDKTFAKRLIAFVENVEVNDAASEEEKQYLLDVSFKLLSLEAETATETKEVIEQAKELLAKLTDEERISLLSDYCKRCGMYERERACICILEGYDDYITKKLQNLK